jgi:aryl-alcohol dehydrogenase-like predicted oxidoreductase
MYFGSKTDKSTSYELLDRYVDAGGTFLDTANIYARWIDGFQGGESETLLGEWMAERGNRDKVFIASKVGFDYQDVPISLSADLIEQECNRSLKRLGVETIDLYYGHKDDRTTPLEETMEAFDRLVKAGKVRYIGASNYLAWRLERAKWVSETNNWAQFTSVQQRYTYLPIRPGASSGRQEVANDDLRRYCADTGTTMLAYSVMLGGAYTRDDRPLPNEYRNSDNEARLIALKAVAQEIGATPNQVILAWMRQSTPSVIPLIAASTIEVLDENIGALSFTLSDEQMQRLNTAGTQ